MEERATLESRFAREVNMMSRVKHENLVKVTVRNLKCNMIVSLMESIDYLFPTRNGGFVTLSVLWSL